jgi:hypothetical protein
MPLDEKKLAEVTTVLQRARLAERPRLEVIRGYVKNQTNDIYLPAKVTPEYRMLVDQARFNVLPLVVKCLVQNLFVDGYRPARQAENSPIWDDVWQRNRMDARQSGIYRAAANYGFAYTTVLPGKPGPVVTPYSPLRLTALYEDPINDEWPRYAMTVELPDALSRDPAVNAASQLAPVNARIWDDTHVYQVIITPGEGSKVTRSEEHGLGVCPVVRYVNEYDVDGESLGEVEPILPLQRQLNQTTFSLLWTQNFQAFLQRWATGMAIEQDEEGNDINPFLAGPDGVWQNESPDGKFGQFDQADLDGYLDSRDKALLFVGSVTQTPPHNLLVGSGISNLSAEALAALESGQGHKVADHQTSFGESHEQMLRLGGLAMGDEDAWNDTSAQVVWRDTTPRSLAQVADALGKLAIQLDIPPRALWERIPGVTDQDLQLWEEMHEARMLSTELPSGEAGAPSEAEDIKAKADAMGALIRTGAEFNSAAKKVGLDGLESSGAVPVTLRLPEGEAAALESS